MRARALSIWLIVAAPVASATTIEYIAPDRIEWTGEIWSADYERFGKLLETHPGVKTLRLRFSRGGAETTNTLMHKTLAPMRIATEAEGPCISSCALIFMEGETRRFVASGTYLHFHGVYNTKTGAIGRLETAAARAAELAKRTGNRTDAALFERAFDVPNPRGGLRVYEDAVYFCKGDEWLAPYTCERIVGATAASLGITTGPATP